MIENVLNEIEEKICDADKVLIGFGEGMAFDWNDLAMSSIYADYEKFLEANPDRYYIGPYLQYAYFHDKNYRTEGFNLNLLNAYKRINALVEGKDYFVITTNTDDYVYEAGFDSSRVVAPCGSFLRMQCDNNCCGEIRDVSETDAIMMKNVYERKVSFNDVKEPVCPNCGAVIRFNQLGVTKYAQEGYSEKWDTYTKWLMGTVNKKIVILELGAGMDYPSLIRFPFEKMISYNLKSFMYRIHPLIYQPGEGTKERCLGIQADPVALLNIVINDKID